MESRPAGGEERLLPPRGLGGRALPRNSAADPGSLTLHKRPIDQRNRRVSGLHSPLPPPLPPLSLAALPPPTALGQGVESPTQDRVAAPKLDV